NWDTRPHPERIIEVDTDVLKVWADILDEPGTIPMHARMVYPMNNSSMKVLEKLSQAPRIRELGLQYSSGWDESIDRRKGYFEIGSKIHPSWEDVILQGPHFSVANPFFKQPNPTMRSNQDWTELDLEALPTDFIPRTSYQPNREMPYDNDYTVWEFVDFKIPARSVPRIGWRLMAATTGVRTFYPTVIPENTAHVNGVISGYSPVFESTTELFSIVGLWSGLPTDFLVKAGAFGHFYGSVVDGLPGSIDDIFKEALARRTARLVCLTTVYAGMWQEVMGTPWCPDSPTRRAKDRRQLMVELDALGALNLSITPDELCVIYRTQFPVLRGYEQRELYDDNGREVPNEISKLYRKVGEEGMTLED